MKRKASATVLALILVLLLSATLIACNGAVDITLSFIVDGEVYHTIDTKGDGLITLPTNPTKEDYVFDGWFWEDGRPFTVNSLKDTPISEDLSVYAKWHSVEDEENDITITFTVIGGGAVPSQTIGYDGLINRPENPVRAGHILVGWFTDADCTTRWDFANGKVRSDMTLYAKWVSETDMNSVEIVKAEGITVGSDTLKTTVPAAQDKYKVFDNLEANPYATIKVYRDEQGSQEIKLGLIDLVAGDNINYIMITSGTGTVKKLYTLTVHRNYIFDVTFNYNNGNSADTTKVEEGKLVSSRSAGSKTGYTFDKWQYNGSAWAFDTAKVTGNMTLDAKWNANKYPVSFDTNGGNSLDNTTVTYGQDFELSVPVREHYTFLGWETADGTTLTDEQGNSISSWDIPNETNLKAKWELKTYTISYTDTYDAENTNPTSFTFETETITLNSLSGRNGYTFIEWQDIEGEKVTSIPKGSSGEITLKAVWEIIDYTITYNNTFGIVHSNPSTYTIETPTINLVDLTGRNGYNFVEWQNTEGEMVTSIPKGSSGEITLKAVWEIIDYTITYNNTFGIVHSNPSTYTIETPTINLVDLTGRNGYNFVEWQNTEGEMVTSIEIGSMGDIALTAVWDIITYEITYNNTFGIVHSNPSTYTAKTETITLTDLTGRTGYTFNGWYTAPADGTKKTNIEKGSYGNLDLYARWELITYSIYYNDVYGVNNPNPTAYTVETDTITLTDLTGRNGYTFVKWQNAEGETVTSIPQGSLGNITLTAVWDIITYGINYNDTFDLTNTNPTKYTIETETITLNELSGRTGYTFTGWYTASTGGEKKTVIAKGSYGNLNLYACWEIITYGIDYNNTYSVSNPNPASYTIETSTITLSSLTGRNGYTFVKWQDEEGNTVTSIPQGSTGDITLTAVWDIKTYDITYNDTFGIEHSNHSSYTVETETITLTALTGRNGYNFTKWQNIEGETVTSIPQGSTGDITLTAVWDIITYGINYNDTFDLTNTNPTNYTIETETITLNELSGRTGYTFTGWYTAPTGGEKKTTIAKGSYGNLSLYAKWTANNNSIIFDGNGATGGNMPNQIVASDATATLDANNYTRIGYTFAGWATTANGAVAYADGANYLMGTNSIYTLFAKWTAEKRTVTLINGNTVAGSVSGGGDKSYESNVTIIATPSTDYTFIGWYENSELVTTNNSYTFAMPLENITFEARWQIKQYTISFQSNGGASVASIIQDYGTIVIQPDDPTREYYTFGGWYSNPALTTPYTFTTMPSGGKVLYAKWDAIRVSSVSITSATNLDIEYSPYTLTANVLPINALNRTVTYTILNVGTTGAAISGDQLSVLYAGTITLRATADGISDSVTITIYDTTVTDVEISNPEKIILPNTPTQIYYTLYPETAVAKTPVTYSIQSSSNTCNATIDEDGKITATTAGSARVRVTADGCISGWVTFYVPQTITTAGELNAIRDNLSGYYMLGNNIDLSSYASWTPIGYAEQSGTELSYSYAFKGYFYGNNYKITGLTINAANVTYINIGLFGVIDSSAILDGITLENYNIYGACGSTTQYIGGLVGINLGRVRNSTISGTINITGGTYVGGAVGEEFGYIASTTANCNITVSTTTDNGLRIGGLVGDYLDGNINECSSSGSISVTSTKYFYAGGLVGNANNTVTNSSSSVSIAVNTSTGISASYAGGLIGYSVYSVAAVSASGNLSITAAGPCYIGGLLGYGLNVYDSTVTSNSITVNCNADIYVGGIIGYGESISGSSSTSALNITKGTLSYIGGLAGRSIDISGSSAAGNITVITSSYGYYGGLAGSVSGIITDSDYTGASINVVTTYSSTSSAYNVYIGGLAGKVTGAIIESDSSASIEANTKSITYLGGLVGHGTVVNESNSTGVTILITGTATVYIGGIVGCGTSLNTVTAIADITITKSTYTFIGGLAGDCTSIANSAFSGDISVVTSTYGYYGGLAGSVAGIITDSNNTGMTIGVVTTYSSTSTSYNVYIGGLAGKVTGTVSGSDSSASVEANTKSRTYIGGLVGYGVNVSESDSTGTSITISGTATIYAGGAVGYGAILDTVAANANIIISSATYVYAGGLAGRSSAVASSHSSGSISIASTNASYIGGLIGYGSGVDNCTVTSNNITVNCNADIYVGGIIGYGESISGSSSTAAVNITKGTLSYIGGLAGRSANISSSYASGNITVTTSTYGYYGGLAGSVSGTITDSDYTGASINVVTTYSSTSTSYNVYIGGLAGKVTGTVSGSDSSTNIEANTKSITYLGGLVGYGAGVSNSNSTGISISAAGTAAVYIGGVVGYGTTISAVTALADITVVSATEVFAGGIAGYGTSVTGVSVSNADEINVVSIGISNIGGIIGFALQDLNDLSSSVNIIATLYNIAYIGGIVGNGQSVSNSINSGSFNITCKEKTYIGGIIGKGVNISNSTSQGNITVDSMASIYLGGVVGQLSGNMSGSRNTGNIDGTLNSSNSSYIGGIAGEIFGNLLSSESYSEIALITSSGDIFAGGLTGRASGANSDIISSQTFGSIKINGSGIIYVGGLTGESTSSISASYSLVDIISTTNGVYPMYAGGLAGRATNDIDTSYATGDIFAAGKASIYNGGLVGYLANDGSVCNAYAAYGLIKIDMSSNGTIGYIGGAIGYSAGVVSNIYSINFTEALASGSEKTAYVGGLIGYNNGTVSRSYALSSIYYDIRPILTQSDVEATAVNEATIYVGGFAGYNASGKTITDSYSSAEIVGRTAYTGGFIGKNDGTLNYVFALGLVNNGISGDMVHGFAGTGTGSYQNAYFSTTGTGITSSTGDGAGVLGKTTTELRNSDTWSAFSGTYWTIINGRLPELSMNASDWMKDTDGYLILSSVNNAEEQYSFALPATIVTISFETNTEELILDKHVRINDTIMLARWVNGYEVEWYANASLTGERVDWEYLVTGALPLYAKILTESAEHSLTTYTITFDKQSGADGSDSVQAMNGYAVPSASAPTRENYNFAGYYTSPGGSGTQYYDAQMNPMIIYSKTSATTLYAKWAGKPFTVTFNKQSGTGGSSSATVTYGDSMPLAIAPSKTGYSFMGYYTGINSSGVQYYSASMTSMQTYLVSGGLTLYAYYTINSYSITYNSNGGTACSPQTYTYDSILSLSATTKSGYTLKGWFTDEALQNEFTLTRMPAENLSLYALWYQNISTASALKNISSTGNYILTANINLSNATWTPIAFSGFFDGNNYKIYNFKITQAYNYTNSYLRIGFFSQNSGIIKNLVLDSYTITASVAYYNYPDSAQHGQIGAVAGYNTGTIYNCSSNGSITVTSTNTYGTLVYTGGIVGDNAGTIESCTSAGTIAANGKMKYGYIGGITGISVGGSTLKYCSSSATISAVPNYTYGSTYVGGVVGVINSSATLTGCRFTGTVSANNDWTGTKTYTGTIYASNSASIRK